MSFLFSCNEQHVWKYKIAPGTGYADSFYIKPDFEPSSFKLQLQGELKQDAFLVLSSYHDSRETREKYLGQHYSRLLKRGPIKFNETSVTYEDDLILVATDTTMIPVPGDPESITVSPLGDLSITVTFD